MNQRKGLWVQGWTGINHSYAMVNQYQLLEFLKGDKVDIYHTESDFYSGAWSRDNVGAGFKPHEAQMLNQLRAYGGERISAVYRIHTPNTLAPAEAKVITFLVTELGLDAKNFSPDVNIKAYEAGGNLIVTPSNWSRDRIVDYGFHSDNVYVVPHGVDADRFNPLSAEQRRLARAALGYGNDDVVLLNVGAPFWNKGMDIVLESFFAARKTNRNLRLLIKDQQALYGMSAANMVQTMAAEGRIAPDEASMAAVSLVPKTLTIEQLRDLYCVADYYLSPYRAEGFNLPVIEAIACGTPVIVTAGGSTDDFCNSDVAIRIPSTMSRNMLHAGHHIGACLNPDMSALVDILGKCARGDNHLRKRMPFGRTDVLETFTWKRAAALLTSLM